MPRRFVLFISLVFLMLILGTSFAIAQSGGGFDLGWFTIDGGGGSSSGGSYSMSGTIGQADAGVMNGGGYTLTGGFWSGEAAAGHIIYLPLTLK